MYHGCFSTFALHKNSLNTLLIFKNYFVCLLVCGEVLNGNRCFFKNILSWLSFSRRYKKNKYIFLIETSINLIVISYLHYIYNLRRSYRCQFQLLISYDSSVCYHFLFYYFIFALLVAELIFRLYRSLANIIQKQNILSYINI
jgi:hypothetical protein